MDLECLKQAGNIVAGSKQTIKAVEAGKVGQVFVATDAEERVLQPVLEACARQNIPVHYAGTMEELGKACGIKVNAAMAAILLNC
jgi:large subunit ribosomal protein L7A